MLSRVAESLFWIGRYLERADGTARILDVHLQLVLEDPLIDEAVACRSLMYIMGSPVPDDAQITGEDVLTILATDRKNSSSIVYSLLSARENGRRAREIISTELWECLNTVTQHIPKRIAAERIHGFFNWVRERMAMAAGIADTTMSRDEAYQFFILGQSLERADMTARLLATRAVSEAHSPSWTTLLRSCGAYEACLRTCRGTPSTQEAAEFLLLDRLFPRSVIYSVTRALNAVRDLDPTGGRTGVSTAAQRVLGHAISNLEYLSIDEIIQNLPHRMDRIQIATSAASEAIKLSYFPSDAIPTWVGEQT